MGRLIDRLKEEGYIIEDDDDFEGLEDGITDMMPLQTYAKLDDDETEKIQKNLIDKIVQYANADADWLDLNGKSTWKCRYCGYLEKEPEMMKEHILTAHNDKVMQWFPDELIWKGSKLATKKDDCEYQIKNFDNKLILSLSLDCYTIKPLTTDKLKLVVNTGKCSKDRLFVHNNEYYFKEPVQEDTGDSKYLMYSLNVGKDSLSEKLTTLKKEKHTDEFKIKINSKGNFAIYYKELSLGGDEEK